MYLLVRILSCLLILQFISFKYSLSLSLSFDHTYTFKGFVRTLASSQLDEGENVVLELGFIPRHSSFYSLLPFIKGRTHSYIYTHAFILSLVYAYYQN